MIRWVAALLVLAACQRTPPGPPLPQQPQQSEQGSAPSAYCPGYCEGIRRCWPEFYYVECPFDCVRLLSSAQESEVSGITGAIVRCWSEAKTCELAAACDYATEGDRK